MRPAFLAPIVAVSALLAASAHADVGPPPKCPAGTHHEYYYGHKCVPDGQTADPTPAPVRVPPEPPIVSASATPAASSSAPATPSAAPAPSAPAAPASSAGAPPAEAAASAPTPAPPAERGCACDLAGAPQGIAGAIVAIAIAGVGLARRTKRVTARRGPASRDRG